MMKRTWNSQHFAQSDTSHGTNRQFLGPQDLDEISYQVHEPINDKESTCISQETPQSESSIEKVPNDVENAASPEREKPKAATGQTQKLSVAQLPDGPIPPSSIVPVMVAVKLKRPEGIQTHKTIAELALGRSALSNEIIGDLHAEFGHGLPEQAESIPLDTLCQSLEASHTGALGKVSSSLVFKFCSSKLPAGFDSTAARRYLNERWGLGAKRQDEVLILSIPRQPTSRFADSAQAEAFLADAAEKYYQREKLALPQMGVGDDHSAGGSALDDKAKQMAHERTAPLIRNVVNVLKGFIDANSPQVSSTEGEHIRGQPTDTEELSLWLSEHGDDYAEGIRPKFDTKMLREYDSYWNWNAQDIEKLYHFWIEDSPGHGAEIEELAASIANRACSRSLAQINNLLKRAKRERPNDEMLINALDLLYQTCMVCTDRDPAYLHRIPDMAPATIMDDKGTITASEKPRRYAPGTPARKLVENSEEMFDVNTFQDGVATYSSDLSMTFAEDRRTAMQQGLQFSERNVLVTGAGKNSIGQHIVRGLLRGGARVTVTTSSFSLETTQMYRDLYAKYGSKGSVLRVIPYNQGSCKDVQDLVQWIQSDDAWDVDFIIPFAAVGEGGRDVRNLDSRSEIAHRVMLTNLLRMLGLIAKSKQERGTLNRPATVVLPLSPNHGLFGADGLYSESKKSLEPLLAKWYSETWAEYLSILGVVIGWTRGTGLMDANDIVAEFVEALGVRTFTAPEMAGNILTLMGGSISAECQSVPLVVDLGGNLRKVPGFQGKLTSIRKALRIESEARRAIAEDRARDYRIIAGDAKAGNHEAGKFLSPLATIQLSRPTLPDYEREIASLAETLKGMVDLSRVVVITGFSELGPHGNSRTRWELEAHGALSPAGSIEMAWMMGLIKHHSGPRPDGTHFVGWVDSKTSEPVNDGYIYAKYMATILQHSGLRKVDPSICDNNYDPEKKEMLQEVMLQYDISPFETTPENARELSRRHGDRAVVTRDAAGNSQVQLKAGATVMIPRSSRFNRTVAGQIPTGWSARRYGIKDDIIEQVDPVTLFSLVCTVEALLCSGIDDPYELYEHIHLSELAICVGSSMGGLSSWRQMQRDRFLDKPVKPDILQETFINTTGAWINMLLTSSCGPLKTPVGACATSLESLDTGHDLITSNKAKFVLVGGVEDFVEDVSFEFGSMNATCNTDVETAAGREPCEMSRPTASSRSGFVESQGCGVQVLTSAELALKMGLPIFGIVALTNMSADGIGRSVPAPGKGVVTNVRESPCLGIPLSNWPLLDLNHRRMMMQRRKKQIVDYVQDSFSDLDRQISQLRESSGARPEDLDQYRQIHASAIEEEAARQTKEAEFGMGNNFWRHDTKQRISPIRGSLATWGLSIDDISFASLHGTSTVKNDINETSVIQHQIQHLGRDEGNLLPCVCQKWLTGHSKGAAGAWMVNGCLQMMNSGIIPGNKNLDNVDGELRNNRHLWFPGETLQMGDDLKACSVTSFGFGQKGSQAILVHPRYLYATVSRHAYEEYAQKMDRRCQRASRSFLEGMMREDLVSSRMKSSPPYELGGDISAMTDSQARF